MQLDPFGTMPKPSIVNVFRVYEIPLSCLQRFLLPTKVQWCSLFVAGQTAAEGSAEQLLSSAIYTTEVRQTLFTTLRSADERGMSGRFCWVQPVEGELVVRDKHYRIRNAAGPAIIIELRGCTAVICVVRLDFCRSTFLTILGHRLPNS